MSDEIITSTVEGTERLVDPAQRGSSNHHEIMISSSSSSSSSQSHQRLMPAMEIINPHYEVVAGSVRRPTRRITAKDIKVRLLYLAPIAALGTLIQIMYPQVSAFEKHPILMDMAVVMLFFYICGLFFTALLVFEWTNYKQYLYDRFSIDGLTHIFGILTLFFYLLVLVSEEGRRLGLLVFLVVIALAIYYSLEWIRQLVYVIIYMMQFSEPSTR